MCIAFLWCAEAADASPYHLILCSNRDEFLARPTQAAHQWRDSDRNKMTFAGKDLTGGGTWLGVKALEQEELASAGGQNSTAGEEPNDTLPKFRYGVITNFRTGPPKPGVPKKSTSRGALVRDYLEDDTKESAKEFCTRLGTLNESYDGYNLILGDTSGSYYISNKSGSHEPVRLTPGIHGLSNGTINDEWPKVVYGKDHMQNVFKKYLSPVQAGGSEMIDEAAMVQDLFAVLGDENRCGDDMAYPQVYDVGITRHLNAVCVRPFELGEGDHKYGTRTSIIMLVRKDGTIAFHERLWNEDISTSQEKKYKLACEPLAPSATL